MDRHSRHRTRIAGRREEVHHVAPNRKGARESGYVTFDAADAGGTPIGDETDRKRVDDRFTPKTAA